VRSILGSNVKVWHILLIGILALVLTGGGVVLAGAGGSFFPAGKVRLASAWSDESVSISGTDNPPVKVLSANFSVPPGKKANLQATFSTSLLHNNGQFAYCFGRFTVDTAPPNHVFRPGPYQLLGGETAKEPNGITVAMTGFRANVGPGDHKVHVYVHSAFAGCTLQERALNVIVNIH
jgi:hypothetical protein